MASLLFLSALCVMFLDPCASEESSSTPMPYSAATDLLGQMFSVNKGGSVYLRSDGPASLSSFTVCLRHISESFQTQGFFRLNLGGPYSISLTGIGGPWTILCATWESGGGMAQVFVNSMPSVRKGMWQNQVFSGRPALTVSGFVGQITDVHVWDYVLSTAAIVDFCKGYVTKEGTVLSWRKAQYSISGTDCKTPCLIATSSVYQTGLHNVTCSASLGNLLLIQLEKEKYALLPGDDWFCSKVIVTTPELDNACFPCFRWVADGQILAMREATARKVFEDKIPQLINHRSQELLSRRQLYRLTELRLKSLSDYNRPWASLEDINRVFWLNKTDIAVCHPSEYIRDHWKEDDFFGYQFLNGVNPRLIRRCSKLPPNFPVTDDMVRPFLEEGTSLKSEMQKGNIFLCDYKLLDGLPANSPEDKLLPIAIQLKQQPGELNPIFLPSDSEHDWLLAKIFVRSAEISAHQLDCHLLRTHAG
ncbi:hypothetical protein AAFF_G00156740 [Aldrovandia affinis]|uniref:Uncharacterized protein n=1 Tax=Aldrovandia affinis TaxID=143900 RepID=A0AAD7RNA4_9TELE|nr:hypothetical protein AAFF_G00156740 [Aldrovandia affinis]